jgi:hypothetical protein
VWVRSGWSVGAAMAALCGSANAAQANAEHVCMRDSGALETKGGIAISINNARCMQLGYHAVTFSPGTECYAAAIEYLYHAAD